MERSEIHAWALAGAATIAALPVDYDMPVLIAEECAIITKVGNSFGRNITKNIAAILLNSEFAPVVGSDAYVSFLTSFEKLNVGWPFTIVAKAVLAAEILELIGNTAYSYFEKEAGK